MGQEVGEGSRQPGAKEERKISKSLTPVGLLTSADPSPSGTEAPVNF